MFLSKECCSAINYRKDKSIHIGVQWLLKVIDSDWSNLSSRVEKDVEEQKEKERKEKLERIERVRKIREQRLDLMFLFQGLNAENVCHRNDLLATRFLVGFQQLIVGLIKERPSYMQSLYILSACEGIHPST